MDIVSGYLIKALLLPPGLNFAGIIAGLIVRFRWRRFGTAIACISFATLWLWSLPFVAGMLVTSAEHSPPFDLNAPGNGEVIVILGGKRNSSAPEYGGDTVGPDTLERLRYGARLARALDLPIAVTGGGSKDPESRSLGELMAQALKEDFSQPARWVETTSRNTAENAMNLRAVLPVNKVVLVTHSLHMKRSTDIFAKAGFSVHAAPIDIPAQPVDGFEFRLQDWLPSASALLISRSVLYEWLGSAYYGLRY